MTETMFLTCDINGETSANPALSWYKFGVGTRMLDVCSDCIKLRGAAIGTLVKSEAQTYFQSIKQSLP